MASAKDIFDVLKQKAQFEVVEHTLSDTQLRVIGRIPEDAMRVNMNNWLIIIRELLRAQKGGAPWTIDMSKQYFLKGPDGQEKVVFGHRIIIQGQNVAQYFDGIVKIIRGTQQAAVSEVTSFPLPGAGMGRNDRDARNGKGAATIKASPR